MHTLFDERYFAFGVNLIWLDGQYDHDFGKNELLGYDFRAYDDKQEKVNLDAYFKDISEMGAHVVRLWLFERFEGLTFDKNGNVNGIDDGLVKNIADVLNVAERYNLYLYICLMDTWGVSVHSQQYLSKLNAIIAKEEVRKSYVDNALKKFITDTRLKTNRIFGIDVLNEPEGMYSSLWRRDIEWVDVMRFINECVNAVHTVNIRVACGFQRYQTLIDNKDVLKNLDFYDYHEYNDDGDLIPYSTLALDKPCIIGECGQKSEKYDDEIYDKTVTRFLDNSWKNGYAGCLIWCYTYRGYDKKDSNNRYSLITSDGKWRRACYYLPDFNEKHKRNMLP
ncbi:MAG: cellulase family glycosylhydrolase [Nitrososphaerales archaeon]